MKGGGKAIPKWQMLVQPLQRRRTYSITLLRIGMDYAASGLSC